LRPTELPRIRRARRRPPRRLNDSLAIRREPPPPATASSLPPAGALPSVARLPSSSHPKPTRPSRSSTCRHRARTPLWRPHGSTTSRMRTGHSES